MVIKGLAEHKREYGSPLCPCRHYDDKAAEVAQGFWNCPCVPMRERHVRRDGLWKGEVKCRILIVLDIPGKQCTQAQYSIPSLQECHCMLFLTPENEFRGEDQTISREEVDAVSQPGY